MSEMHPLEAYAWLSTRRRMMFVSVRSMIWEIPKTTKPDCDNLSKTITDIMTTLQFFGDDAQIAELWVSKKWAPTGSVSINLKEVVA